MSDSEARRLRDKSSGPGTLISAGCTIKGVISGHGNFLINGEVEGDCEIDGSISLTESSIWHGTIKAHSVIVAGTVEGDIEADGRVEISSTARISGSVAGEEIAVAVGAIVDGVMKTAGRAKPIGFIEKRQSESVHDDKHEDD